MEPTGSSVTSNSDVWVMDGLTNNTVNPCGISEEISINKKLKEETDDDIELSREFKAEPSESFKEMELKSVPWMKQEDEGWPQMHIKQEWAKTDNETTDPLVQNEKLCLDKLPQCIALYSEGEKQLFKQSHSLGHPELCGDVAGTSRSSWLSSSGVPVMDGEGVVTKQEIIPSSDESGLKVAADADLIYNPESCGTRLASDFCVAGHSIGYQQRKFFSYSQVLDEAETEDAGDDMHSDSGGDHVQASIKCQVAGTLHSTHVFQAHESNFTECSEQKPENLNGILDTNLRNHHSAKIQFECHVCRKIFNKKSSMIRHRNIHTGEKPFECNVCRKRFTQKSYLLIHANIHTGKKPFECIVCRKKFNRKSQLTVHANIHTGEKPFECNICKKKFTQKYYLEIHANIHTGKKAFECSVCRKKFNRKSQLTVHANTHTDEKPFECSICKNKFNYKSSLNVHERIHTGEKVFECNVCNKRFNRKSHLTSHVRVHTGKKPYECDVCRKKFNHKSNLILHINIHSGGKSFECSICKKKFNQKSSMVRHKSIHTGEKPFECHICKKQFSWKSSFIRHKITHVDEEPFKCNVCRKKFSQKAHLITHASIHAGKKNT